MISSSQACGSFKKEVMLAIHDLINDLFRIALYDATANLGPATTGYTTTGRPDLQPVETAARGVRDQLQHRPGQ